MKKINRILSLAIVALLCTGTLAFMVPVHAATTTMEIINPANGTHIFNFTIPPTNLGDTFTVNLTIKNVVTLGSWQARVSWDPLLLTFVNLTLPADHVFAGKSPIQAPTDSSVPGTVLCGAAAGPGAGTFTGDGTLAVMNLRIAKAVSSNGTRQVSSNISFTSLGADTFLLNGDSIDIPFEPISGYYSYTAPPPPPAVLYIDPPKIVDPSLVVGSDFNLSLKIANATNLSYWNISVFYSNSILSVATPPIRGEFLDTFGSGMTSVTMNSYNATHGVVQFEGTFSTPAYGDGRMVILPFHVLGLGESPIVISQVTLLDPTSLALPSAKVDGYFNNVLLAKLSIDPDLITGPGYVPGTTFRINVTLGGFENLKTCIFNLTYNPMVIQEIAISTPAVQGQNPLKKLLVDDANGYIWTNLTYRNGISSVAPVTVMTVEFQVLAMGVSPIDLTETQLFDTTGGPIIHETHNGLFIGLIRDVAVTNVTTDLHIAYQGWTVFANVTVKNKGNVTETFDIHLYFDGNPGGTSTVSGLIPDEERIAVIAWNTSSAQPCHNYTISATADPVPFEMNLADNNFTDGNVKIRIMGDVNGDGTVNMRDINQLILVFRTYPGRPGWDPLNDLDRNGIIDMRDITICILNFGKTCP